MCVYICLHISTIYLSRYIKKNCHVYFGGKSQEENQNVVDQTHVICSIELYIIKTNKQTTTIKTCLATGHCERWNP